MCRRIDLLNTTVGAIAGAFAGGVLTPEVMQKALGTLGVGLGPLSAPRCRYWARRLARRFHPDRTKRLPTGWAVVITSGAEEAPGVVRLNHPTTRGRGASRGRRPALRAGLRNR